MKSCRDGAEQDSVARTASTEDHAGGGGDGVGHNRCVRLHGRLTRIAEPDNPVDATVSDRVSHRSRSDDGRGDMPTERAGGLDQIADRRVTGDDDPGVRGHSLGLSLVSGVLTARPRRAVRSRAQQQRPQGPWCRSSAPSEPSGPGGRCW